MEYKVNETVIFATISSILVIVGTILLFAKKLKPTRRLYRDRPEVWVKVGFWSYVFIQWMICYGYWGAREIAQQDRGITFEGIARTLTSTADHSWRQLANLEKIKIEKPKIGMNPTDAGAIIGAAIGIEDFSTTISEFKSQISSTEKIANKFIASIGKCDLGLPVSPNDISNTFANVTTTVGNIESEKILGEVQQVAAVLIDVFQSEAVTMEGEKMVKKSLSDRKQVLANFKSDMKNMEFQREEIVEDLKPLVVDKVAWIKQVTYSEIFVTLAISSIILVGFGRLEEFMGFRWPARLCAISVPLSAVNILIFSAFVVWMSTFSCPPEAEKIDLDQFTSNYKLPHSNAAPTKICRSPQDTIFTGLNHLDDFSLSIDHDSMKSEIAKTQNPMESLKVDEEIFAIELAPIDQLLPKLKNIGDKCDGTSAKSDLNGLIGGLENFLKGKENVKNMMTIWNRKVDNQTVSLGPLIHLFLQDAQKSIKLSMATFESKMKSADVACSSINYQVNQCRQLLCMILDVDLDQYWYVLDFVMLLLVWQFVLNIVVYRTISLWEIEFRSPASARPPQPPTQAPRRHRRRRLHPHLF